MEGDYEEVQACVPELGSVFFSYEFVRRLLMLAIEATDKEREMASRLLSLLHVSGDVSVVMMGKGFERLFETIDDLAVDVPGARALAAKFTARAVADEVLPPSFLGDTLVQTLAGSIADEAKSLLSMRRSASRLEHCWGVTGANSVAELRDAVRALLREYFVEQEIVRGGRTPGDTCALGRGRWHAMILVRMLRRSRTHRPLRRHYPRASQEEAVRSVRELQAPGFMHEVAYRIIQTVIDAAPAPAVEQQGIALIAALRSSAASSVLSEYALSKGFTRALRALPESVLDNPVAEATLNSLLDKCVAAELLLPATVAAIRTSMP